MRLATLTRTPIRVNSLIGLDISLQEAGKLGKKASKICRNNGVTVDKTSDPRFGTVNVYPKWVLEEVFDDIN